jgi:hypothetical protein
MHGTWYPVHVLHLPRAWLVAIAGVTVIGGGGALVMRVELIDPGGTLSPAVYSHALVLHALTMLGVFLAVFVAIPTLVIRPGRGAIVLGGLAFAVWAAMTAFFIIASFAPADWVTGSPLGPGSLRAASVALATAWGWPPLSLPYRYRQTPTCRAGGARSRRSERSSRWRSSESRSRLASFRRDSSC